MGEVISMLQYKADKEEREWQEEEKIIEQQYEEFINLIQYVAKTKEVKYNIVHINVNKNRTYTFKDEEMNNIDIPSVLDGSPIYHYDDMIVSNMITVSSKKYIVYGSEYWSEETRKTLMRIFEDKIVYHESEVNEQ
jgi:hypothetical protein